MKAPSDQGPSASSCYVEVKSDEEDDEVGDTNPDNYYTFGPATNLAEDVKLFMNTTFRRCIPKKRRLEMANEYPRPDVPQKGGTNPTIRMKIFQRSRRQYWLHVHH